MFWDSISPEALCLHLFALLVGLFVALSFRSFVHSFPFCLFVRKFVCVCVGLVFLWSLHLLAHCLFRSLVVFLVNLFVRSFIEKYALRVSFVICHLSVNVSGRVLRTPLCQFLWQSASGTGSK